MLPKPWLAASQSSTTTATGGRVIFSANGAPLSTGKKSDPKYWDRLYRNDGNGVFTDVTEKAGLKGTGFDVGVAIGDYDNDGHPDMFVAGVHDNTLYHNNGDGTFTDVTTKAGLDKSRSRIRPALVCRRSLGRREQRRLARSVRRQLHAVDILRQTPMCPSKVLGILPSPLLQRPAQPALS